MPFCGINDGFIFAMTQHIALSEDITEPQCKCKDMKYYVH